MKKSLCIALVLVLCVSARVDAAFHLMRISEIMPQAGGDTRIQFVELQMTAGGQNFVGGHTLEFFDANGNQTGEFTIPSNVGNGNTNGYILFGTQAFADASSVRPDFLIPAGLLSPFSGRVCFEDIDCVAYGAFTGDNSGYGDPASGFAVVGFESLRRTRTASPRDNSTDFELGTPDPTDNDGAAGELAVAGPACFLEGKAANSIASWDVPEAGVGFDLTNCGTPAQVDTGTLGDDGETILFMPGETDQLDLGNPIVIASMANKVASPVIKETGESFRAKFDVFAEFGIVQAAVFLHQTNGFEDGALDSSVGGGMGMNFTFGCHQPDAPDPCPDGESDHFHPDVRAQCLQEGDLTAGPRDGLFSGLEFLEPETAYTIIMDIDGDALFGPLTLRAKVFEVGTEEPADYGSATWQVFDGLGFDVADEDQHLMLFAVLRSAGVDQGPVLRFSNLSFCEIPRNQKSVRFVNCSREPGGEVLVTWNSPFDMENEDIRIFVNGELDGVADGDETDYFVEDPPEGTLTITVVNYSGVGSSCTLCQNQPPIGVIDGPTEVKYSGDPVVVTLDGSASEDPEGTDLFYIWEVQGMPDGATAEILDSFAASTEFTLDGAGDYEIVLSVTDSGCPGDETFLEVFVEHTVTLVADAGAGYFRADTNTSGAVDLSDAVFTLNFLFLGGAAPTCDAAADANDSGGLDLSDAVFTLNFLFLGGAAPPDPGPLDCGSPATPSVLSCNEPSC